MIFRILRLFAVPFASLYLIGCNDDHDHDHDHHGHDHAHDEKPVVVVPVPPYAGLVERIAGPDAVEILTLVEPGQDPHGFSPTPKQIAKASDAAVFFTVGMPFEEDLVAAFEKSDHHPRIVDLTKGVDLLEHDHDHHGHDHHGHDHGEHDHKDHDHDHKDHDHDHAAKPKEEKGKAEDAHDHKDHDHDHEGHDHHDHGENDPHIWLSPELLINQVRVLHYVLEEVTGQNHSGEVHKNAEELEAAITQLDYDLALKLKPIKGQSFYVYHGAFGYFAQAYGLKQESIEIGGRKPEPKQLAALIEKAKSEGVKMIFVQPQFDQTSAKAIADAIGGTVLSVDPLETDVLANLQKIADAIIESQ
ncbi:MAG: zinc ABC transporter solute-binding protein [Verrucomicrobiales bacterium]|nr:zinc ABC transporter solute-binding protein [Verrucomicrobiales bacterium]